MRYNNSKEGILRGITHNYDAIEVDVCMSADGIPVLTHRFEPDDEIVFDSKPTADTFLKRGALEGETALSLNDFVHTDEFLQKFNGIYIIDCGHGDEYAIADWLKENCQQEMLRKIAFQVHTIDMAKKIEAMKIFGHIHYNGTILEIYNNLEILNQLGIHTCSIDNREIKYGNAMLSVIINSNLHVITYTINHMRRLHKMFEIGCSGIFTDFLEPSDIEFSNKE